MRKKNFVWELDEHIHSLECLRCNLDLIYYGMAQDSLGEDRFAVKPCAEMLEVIMGRLNGILEDYRTERRETRMDEIAGKN